MSFFLLFFIIFTKIKFMTKENYMRGC